MQPMAFVQVHSCTKRKRQRFCCWLSVSEVIGKWFRWDEKIKTLLYAHPQFTIGITCSWAYFWGFECRVVKCNSLFCVFHFQQALKQKLDRLACKKAHRQFTSVFCWRKAGTGIKKSIENAINSAIASYTTYITNEWWKMRHKWAMAYRSHSFLLLQIPITSLIEGYHSASKGHKEKFNFQQFCL